MSSSPMSGSPIGMGTGASQVSQTQTVGNYKLTLMVGPQEQMYTQAQVGQQHPTSGEVMVSGSMSMPESSPMTGMATPLASTASGMAMGTNVEHLELHVYDNSSGKTVTDANVTIEVIDNTAQNMSTNVPIATMYGVQAGMDDFHYGDNVVMPPEPGLYRQRRDKRPESDLHISLGRLIRTGCVRFKQFSTSHHRESQGATTWQGISVVFQVKSWRQ